MSVLLEAAYPSQARVIDQCVAMVEDERLSVHAQAAVRAWQAANCFPATSETGQALG